MELIGRLKKASVWAWNLIFPKECVGCSAEGAYLCEKCFKEIKLRSGNVCFLCNRRFALNGVCGDCLKNGGLDSLIVATNYKETLVQRMIKHLKYNFVEEFAEALAKLLILQISENGHKFFTDKTVVIPVPLHRRRFLERGFNQTGLIADRIAAHYGLTVELGVVDRAKKTKPQFGLDREARTENVAGAFVVVDPDKINNCDALIVDDILTTGATLNELARALKSAGARRVIGLAVAHE